MQLDVRFSGVGRSHRLNCNLEAAVLAPLERFRHWVRHVCLYVEDINGPRGGVDKQCRFVVHLRHMPPIVIQDRDETMLPLLHRIANRAAHTLSRKTKRKKMRASGKGRGGLSDHFASKVEANVA